MENYLIYKHTCPNGKSYIGITSDYEKRCIQHQKTRNCSAFYDAIMFFGWDNIKHEILIDGITKEQAMILESKFIMSHETFFPVGYNLKIKYESTNKSVIPKKHGNSKCRRVDYVIEKNKINNDVFFRSVSKEELRERFGSIPNAFAIGNKYRKKPASHRISEQWNNDRIPEEWAIFFWSVLQYEAKNFNLVVSGNLSTDML